jgi:hypothetical protein
MPAWHGADIYSNLTLSYQSLDERPMNPLRLRIAVQQGCCIALPQQVRCILIARRVGEPGTGTWTTVVAAWRGEPHRGEAGATFTEAKHDGECGFCSG